MECKRCGKCCSEAFYRQVRPDDVKGWREKGRDDLVEIYEDELSRREHLNTDMATKGMALHTCRFLKGEGPGRLSCEIYDERPITCHEFEVGRSRLCAAYKGKKKIKE